MDLYDFYEYILKKNKEATDIVLNKSRYFDEHNKLKAIFNMEMTDEIIKYLEKFEPNLLRKAKLKSVDDWFEFDKKNKDYGK